MRVVKDNDATTVYLHSEREKRDMKHLITALELERFYDFSHLRKTDKRNYGRFVLKIKKSP